MVHLNVTTSDSILWRQFHTGDGSALESLMTIYFRTLFNYGCKFSSNQDFIKDCIQELFLTIWQTREKLNPEINVKAYLLASLRRRIHRELTSKKNLFLSMYAEPNLDFAMELSVEESFIQDESAVTLAKEVQTQLENLPKRQREVIYLKFFEGLSRDQIASVMGITEQSISNLLQGAIKQLKANWNSAIIAILLGIIRV